MATQQTSAWTGERVRVEEPSTGFAAVASPDFQLSYDRASGTYELRSEQRGASVMYTRLVTSDEPAVEAREAAQRLGLTPFAEQERPGVAVLDAARQDGLRWTIRAEREPSGALRLLAFGKLPGATRAPAEELDDLHLLNSIAATVDGGVLVQEPQPGPTAQPARATAPPIEVTAPAAQPAPPQPAAAPGPPQPPPPQFPTPIPLRDVAAEDKSVTGKAPDEEGWVVEAVGGAIRAARPDRGEMWLGFQAQITMPGEMAMFAQQAFGPGGGGQIVAPWMAADQAVVQIWPRILNQVGGGYEAVEIVQAGNVQSTQFASYGDYSIRYRYGGQPWRGYISMHTSPVAWLQQWRLMCGWIGVPEPGDQGVWEGLVLASKAYRPKTTGDPAAVKEAQKIARQSSADTFETLQEMNRMQREAFGWSGGSSGKKK